jgi:hypothetical protein
MEAEGIREHCWILMLPEGWLYFWVNCILTATYRIITGYIHDFGLFAG